jgi:hypothetical protein
MQMIKCTLHALQRLGYAAAIQLASSGLLLLVVLLLPGKQMQQL